MDDVAQCDPFHRLAVKQEHALNPISTQWVEFFFFGVLSVLILPGVTSTALWKRRSWLVKSQNAVPSCRLKHTNTSYPDDIPSLPNGCMGTCFLAVCWIWLQCIPVCCQPSCCEEEEVTQLPSRTCLLPCQVWKQSLGSLPLPA